MPEVDEALQDRQTYGNAPGWSENQTQKEPVVSAPASVPAPPAEDVAAAPSAVEAEPAAPVAEPAPSEPAAPEQDTPPSTPAVGEDVPFNKHPRWIERQAELERERQRAAAAERQAQLLLETLQRTVPQPQPAPQPDIWAGKIDHPDPATAQFYQQQKQMVEWAIEQGKQRAVSELQPVIQAGMQKLAAIDTKTFRQENPDIKPGSEEESMVIAYMEGRVDGVRHPIESARNNAVIKRIEAENRAYKAKTALTPQKRAAAISEPSAGIPATAGLPGRPSTARDRAAAVIRQGGEFKDVLSAFFG